MSQEKKATYEISLGGEPAPVSIRRLTDDGPEPAYEITIGDDAPFVVHALTPEAGVLSLRMEGRSWEAGLVPQDDGFVVDLVGIPHDVEVVDPRRRALRHAAGGGAASVKTQMPGRIVRILVEEGQAVSKGEPLLVIEAMKMENEMKAPMDATVARILVAEGDLVETRAVLVELG
jgi:biotin carboxyl carrier protein